MISTDDVERAVDWLRDNAAPAAKARAERIYMESWIKVVLAQEMQRHDGLPLAAQEREARVAGAYVAALDALRAAVEADEKARFLRDAASAKIEAWRTMEANKRAERIT